MKLQEAGAWPNAARWELARTVKATSSVVDLAMTSESAGASVLEYVRETRGKMFSGTLPGAKWIVESLRVFIKKNG